MSWVPVSNRVEKGTKKVRIQSGKMLSKPIHFKKRFKNSIKNRRNICKRRRSFSCWRVAMRDIDGGAFFSRNQRRQDRPAAAAVVVAVAGWSRRWSGTQPAAHLNI